MTPLIPESGPLSMAAIRKRADLMTAASERCRTAPGLDSMQTYAGACIDAGRDVPALLGELDRLTAALTRMAETSDRAVALLQAEQTAECDEIADVHATYARELRKVLAGESS